ncbi:MAG: NAD-dependent succinate-semialdehyde dehydrogenase [Deltaproteobacteria bacterium]|nr:NAD-dependent succinate-semialdehyde dehydrogenase [Deltaproteobacteria bacterium]
MELTDQALFKEKCYVDGSWVAAPDGATLEVTNPAGGERLGSVPALGREGAAAAVEAAARALPAWRALTAKERARHILEWFRLMMAAQEDLARILTTEQGKPLAEARGEVAYAASFLEWFAEEGKRLYGEVIPTHNLDQRILVLREPVGVAAAITPWNFPAAMIARKVGPALAAGCTVVVKPASQTPFSALAQAELAARAGLPAGVVNVITGPSAEIGQELTANPLVRKLSFTGSTAVGRLLMAACAPTVKKISLELGGNAPFLVFDDADLDAALAGALIAKYRNSGQTCVCTNRFLVQDGVYDEFTARLAEKVAALKLGNGLEPGVEQGPLIDQAALTKVEDLVADALASGAKLLTGGKRSILGGTYYEPTVLTEVNSDMRVTREEIFGPVAPVFRFSDEAQGVALANDTIYGLAAYFYARDVGRIFRVAEALEYGMVGINTGIISTEIAPFGGVKQSGLGREGSRHGIDEYSELKYLCLAGVKG